MSLPIRRLSKGQCGDVETKIESLTRYNPKHMGGLNSVEETHSIELTLR